MTSAGTLRYEDCGRQPCLIITRLMMIGEKSRFCSDALPPEKLLPMIHVAEGFRAAGAGCRECACSVAAG
jgi:hypothetical protein